MPHHQEKKFQVQSFSEIKQLLSRSGAQPQRASTSIHYYAPLQTPGVVKLVVHGDKAAIHILDEQNGKFTLSQNIAVKDKAAGLQWLGAQGFTKVFVVTMAHTDYEYKDGIVGLYFINNDLKSVILDFPPGQHNAIAAELGLANAQIIAQPYNVYLQQQGKLEPVAIEDL
jgi:hypothetical protein